jgi:hypothetical protein
VVAVLLPSPGNFSAERRLRWWSGKAACVAAAGNPASPDQLRGIVPHYYATLAPDMAINVLRLDAVLGQFRNLDERLILRHAFDDGAFSFEHVKRLATVLGCVRTT